MAETILKTCGTGADGGTAVSNPNFIPISWTNPNNIAHGQDETAYSEVVLTPREDV